MIIVIAYVMGVNINSGVDAVSCIVNSRCMLRVVHRIIIALPSTLKMGFKTRIFVQRREMYRFR